MPFFSRRFLKRVAWRNIFPSRSGSKADRLAHVYEVAAWINESFETEKILEGIADKIRRVFRFDATLVYLLDPRTDQLVLRASSRTDPQFAALAESFEREKGVIGAVAVRGEPLILEDVRTDPRYRELSRTRLAEKSNLVFLAMFPIKSKSQCVGVFAFFNRHRRTLAAEDVDLIVSLSHQVEIVLQRARLYEEARRRALEQEMLNGIAAAASQSLEVEEILNLALDKVLEVTGRDAGYIRLKDPATGEISLAASRGVSKGYVEELLYRRTADGKSDRVFSSGQSIVVNDPDGTMLKDATRREGYHSVAWVPVKARGKVLGVLNVSTRRPVPFAPRDIELLETIGSLIGNATENGRLFEATLRNVDRLRALREIDTAISSTLDLNGVMNVLLEKIEGFFPNSASAVRLFSKETGDLEPVACRNIDEETWRSLRYSGGVRSSLREKVPLIVEDVYSAPETRFPEFYQKHGLNSFIRLPLVVRDELVGALAIYLKEKHRFTSDEVEFLSMVAQQAAIAIHNAQLFEQTTRQAIELATANRHLIEQEEIQKLLKELSQDITLLDLDSLFRKLTDKIREVFDVDICDVRIMDDGSWTVLGMSGAGTERIVAVNSTDPHPRARWIIENRKPLCVPDITAEHALSGGGATYRAGIRGFLGVPIFYRGGEVAGVLRLLSYRPKEFQPEAIDLLQQIANSSGIALENLRLLQRTKRQAVELERANRLKSEFLSVMSHELRTPLTVVLGYAEMIQDGFFGTINPEQKGALQTVLKRSGDLLKMINSVLEVTRIEADRVGLEAQRIRLSDLMEDLKSDYSRRSNGRVRLLWEYSHDSPEIKIDSPKVKQIVQNLIDNGLKFTMQGSVTVTTRCLSDVKKVEFQVKDTGIGIGAQDQKIIFDMFHQVDSSDTRTYGGAGVGLFVAKKFVELLGGDIHVESELGRGSTFTVTLPYSPA